MNSMARTETHSKMQIKVFLSHTKITFILAITSVLLLLRMTARQAETG
jgi:hypothetical protein